MDAAQASPVSAWLAVSREQNDHPLVHDMRIVRLRYADVIEAAGWRRWQTRPLYGEPDLAFAWPTSIR